MKFKVFSVFDTQAENFNTPMFLAAKGQAIRAFDDQANAEDSMIYKHPDDYQLFYIGEFDDDTGTMIPTKPEMLGSGIDYKRS